MQAIATALSQDQDRPSLEGATLSLCKYASELAGYGVISVIAMSIFLFLYMLQGRTAVYNRWTGLTGLDSLDSPRIV